MPQQPRPESCWLEWVPIPEDRLLWVHRLGNLALLTRKKNSAANNYDFDRKKAAYFTKGGVSPFALTTQVLQHSDWTVKVLEEREAQLLEVLQTHWRLQDRQSPRSSAMNAMAAQTVSGDSPLYEIKSQKQNLTASAREVDGDFTVLAGSQARLGWTGQFHGYQALKQQLIDTGSLTPAEGGVLQFSEDVSFSSPSAASAVIFGRPDNGRTSWLVKATGQTYAELEQGLPAGGSLLVDEDDQVGPVNRQEILRNFWAKLIERSLLSTQLFANRNSTSDQWMSLGIGRTGFFLCLSVTQTSSRAECYVRFSGDKDRSTRAFEALRSERLSIEQIFGEVLEWHPLQSRSGSRICLEMQGGWKLPEEQWPQLQDRLIDAIVRLDLALRDYIQKLDV